MSEDKDLKEISVSAIGLSYTVLSKPGKVANVRAIPVPEEVEQPVDSKPQQ